MNDFDGEGLCGDCGFRQPDDTLKHNDVAAIVKRADKPAETIKKHVKPAGSHKTAIAALKRRSLTHLVAFKTCIRVLDRQGSKAALEKAFKAFDALDTLSKEFPAKTPRKRSTK